MSGFKMDDYVDVAERIREFSEKYPDGSLQAELTFQNNGWLCRAYAYRSADDERPGIGHAFEPVPGKTPYTKDSEAMNAETSGWGRAIVALGFQTKKIASAQEVQARQSGGGTNGTTDGNRPAATQHKPVPASAAASSPTEHHDTDPHGLKSSRADFVPPAPALDRMGAGTTLVPFGKYKGTQVSDVPKTYWAWWLSQEQKTDALIAFRAQVELFLLGTDGVATEVTVGGGADDDIPFAPTFA